MLSWRYCQGNCDTKTPSPWLYYGYFPARQDE